MRLWGLIGNDNRDACNYSPAAAENAVTVGASTLGDERASFSNHGKCVDVFAPGLNILSTYKGSPTAINTLSGTSMASPHTAGLLAYLLSIYPSPEFDPTFDSAEELVSLHSQRTVSVYLNSASPSLFAMAHRILPPFISSYLPSPDFLNVVLKNTAVAPVPNPTLSPLQMKKALLRLATPDALATLPPQTANYLIFNNATRS